MEWKQLWASLDLIVLHKTLIFCVVSINNAHILTRTRSTRQLPSTNYSIRKLKKNLHSSEQVDKQKTGQDKTKQRIKHSDLTDSISLEPAPSPDPTESRHIQQNPHAGNDQELTPLKRLSDPRHFPTPTTRNSRSTPTSTRFAKNPPTQIPKRPRKHHGRPDPATYPQEEAKAASFDTSNESDGSTEQ